MNIADRIQHLRKSKGISQEELADKIGVSRQAVSKWESEQSTPDIEKIILISNFFDVTTDYLLKGIEPSPTEVSLVKEKPNASIFTIVGTAFNSIGLILTIIIWHEEQRWSAFAVGFILIVTGCMIYAVGMLISDPETQRKAKRNFWLINIWVWLFFPFSFIYRFLLFGFNVTDWKLLLVFVGFSPARTGLFVFLYVIFCGIIDFGMIRLWKRRDRGTVKLE